MMKKISIICGLALTVGATLLAGCDKADNAVEKEKVVNVPGIPDDKVAKPNPDVLPEEVNTYLPNFSYVVSRENGWIVVRFDMTGVQDPTALGEWVKLYGPGNGKQNVWLSVDGQPKGFTVSNSIDDVKEDQTKDLDLVFLVDNSGSMDDEANTLANEVYAWSQKLTQSGLDMRFGCVGYDGRITGGMNMGTIDDLDEFLNASGRWGTSRTTHFVNKDGDDWDAWRSTYFVDSNVDECGVAALRLADEKFAFRPGANRVYVNFTDEPNYSRDETQFSVEYVKDPANWPATKGTIHTVFSEDSTDYWVMGYINQYSAYERPWNLSEYTGGTVKFVPYNFAGVTLDDLPVTGALRNSYIIRFTNVEELFDGNMHEVHITIKSDGVNGKVIADKTFNLIFEN